MEKKNLIYSDIVFRSAEGETESREVEGIASVFNQKTDLGWFTEEIDRGAFDGCDMTDVVLNFNHDNSMLLAGTRNGSLTLAVTDEGLLQRGTIIDTTQGRDVLKLLREGLITKMSFAFTIDPDGGDEWIYERGAEKEHRVIKKIKRLYDVSLVTFPAYEGTSVGMRSIDAVAEEHISLAKKRKEQDERMAKVLNG